MNPAHEASLLQTRRQFFGDVGLRAGGIALGLLLGESSARAAVAGATERIQPAQPGLPHFPPRARSLIYLHMNGGPAQPDLWDNKPKLKAYFDKELPASGRNGQRITTTTGGHARGPVAPRRFAFPPAGPRGAP